MLQVDHFSAWVTVDGVELPQYAIEYSLAEKHATCWIASEAGKVCKRAHLPIFSNDLVPRNSRSTGKIHVSLIRHQAK
jgi:hypothetical protein